MIQLRQLTKLSPEQLDLLPVEGRDIILRATRFTYEAVGEVPYGIVGVVAPSMLAREAVVWFVPYADLRPSRQEIRAAKQFSLAKAIGFIPLADVHVDDIPAIKFAKFFGLKKQSVDGEYYRYVGEN